MEMEMEKIWKFELRAILFILSFKLKGRGGYLVFSWRVLTWLFN